MCPRGIFAVGKKLETERGELDHSGLIQGVVRLIILNLNYMSLS